MADNPNETEPPTRFGWCIDGHHTTCPHQITSSQTRQPSTCRCPCHRKAHP